MSNSATPWTAARQASLSITNSWSWPNSYPLSQWCYPTISSFVIPFSSCLQFFLASGSFPMSQFFISGGQSIGASASVLPMNIQDWFPLGLTGWISLPSKVLSRVSSNTTIHTHVYMCVNIRYLFFSFWLTSFCMTVSRSIHVSANGTTSFLSMTE